MWIKTSKRRLFLDMHFPDWEGKEIASKFNPKDIAETFSKSNIDSAIVYAKCQYGNFYYDTDLGHKHSGLGSSNFFIELKEELHKRDIKVIAYYSVSWDEYIANKHPEYLTVDSQGQRDNTEFRWQTLCINSSYRHEVKEHLREITNLCEPDGFWIDMTIIGEERCFCPNCREKFETIYGCSMPLVGDPNYNLLIDFRYNYIEEFYKELEELIHGINPDIQITNNYWGYPYSKASMGSRAIGAVASCNYITGEAYTDWTGLNAPSFFTKFLKGIAGQRPYEALIGRFYNTWDYTKKTYEQLAFEAFTTVANGACVTLDDEPYYDGSIDKQLYSNIQRIFGEIKRREHLLDGEQENYGAIFHSQLTKDVCTDKLRFIRSIAGSYKMMRDLHLPMTFIFDENLQEQQLSKFKCILLPSVECIRQEDMEILKNYVSFGGTLIFTGVTPLLKDIKTSALADYFNIISDRDSCYSLSYGKVHDHLILAKGTYMCYHSQHNGEGNIVEPICETTKDRFFHNNLPAPYNETASPFMIVENVGRGKVICFAQPILNQYAKQSQWDIREAFKSTIDNYITKPSFSFKMPIKVDIAVSCKEEKFIIHLMNPNPALSVCCGYMDPFEGAYPRTIEYMEEIAPVLDLEIVCNIGNINKVETLEKANNFKLKGNRVLIKELRIWETVVITLN